MRNTFIVRFNGRRDDLLNETTYTSLAQTRTVLKAWPRDYSTVRPLTRLVAWRQVVLLTKCVPFTHESACFTMLEPA